jgi:hypothetical protein
MIPNNHEPAKRAHTSKEATDAAAVAFLALSAAIREIGLGEVVKSTGPRTKTQVNTCFDGALAFSDACDCYTRLSTALLELPGFLRLCAARTDGFINRANLSHDENVERCIATNKLLGDLGLVSPASGSEVPALERKTSGLAFLVDPEVRLILIRHLITPKVLEKRQVQDNKSVISVLVQDCEVLQSIAKVAYQAQPLTTLTDKELNALSLKQTILLQSIDEVTSKTVSLLVSHTAHLMEVTKKKLLPHIRTRNSFRSAIDRAELAPSLTEVEALAPFDERLRRSLGAIQPFTTDKSVTRAFMAEGAKAAQTVKIREQELKDTLLQIDSVVGGGEDLPRKLKILLKRVDALVTSLSAALVYAPLPELDRSKPQNRWSPSANLGVLAASTPILGPAFRICSLLLVHYGVHTLGDALAESEKAAQISNEVASSPEETGSEKNGTSTEADTASPAADARLALSGLSISPSRMLTDEKAPPTWERTPEYRQLKHLNQRSRRSGAREREDERAECLELIQAELNNGTCVAPEDIRKLKLFESEHTRSLNAWVEFSAQLKNALPSPEEMWGGGPQFLSRVLCAAPWLLTLNGEHFGLYIEKLSALTFALACASNSEKVPAEYRRFAPSAMQPEYSILGNPDGFRRIKDLAALQKRVEDETKILASLTSPEQAVLHPVVVFDVVKALAAVATDGGQNDLVATTVSDETAPLVFAKSLIKMIRANNKILDTAGQSHLDTYERQVLTVYQALGRNLKVSQSNSGNSTRVSVNLEQSLPEDATIVEKLLRELLEAEVIKRSPQPVVPLQQDEKSHPRHHKTRQRLDNSAVPLNSVRGAWVAANGK